MKLRRLPHAATRAGAADASAAAEYEAYANSDIRLRLFRESLRFFPTGSVIDLGAGHCAFAILADELGWIATALDARTERRPELASSIRFIHAQVETDAWNPSDYDLILCLGLYYHMTQEAQHGLLARIAGRPLVLDTHWATTDSSGWFTRSGQLTPLATVGSEEGAYFLEAPHLSGEERKTSALTASMDNDRSWWPTLPSLQTTLREFGYQTQWIAAHPYAGAQRSFIIATP